MTGMAAYMLAGLEQGHGIWSYHSLDLRPVNAVDTSIHPSSL